MRHLLPWPAFLNEDFSSWIGGGTEHEIFEDPEHVDRVYKTSIGGEIDPRVVDLFRAHPSIFPRVYKATEEWMNIERLDTDRARMEYDYLTRFLEEGDTPDLLEEFFETLDENLIPRLSAIFDQAPMEISQTWMRWKATLEGYLRAREDHIQKWNAWLQSLSYEEMGRMRKTSPIGDDLHEDQFGYSSEGVLKILDI
jgi:hypothetical protein